MKAFLFCIFLLCAAAASAQDRTVLGMNAVSFNRGDSIEFGWNGNVAGMAYPLATMHLWIDNIETGQRWKFRYPIINGEAAGALGISEQLKPGTYAFNFLGADQHLEIFGRMRKVKLKMAQNHETGKMDTIAVYDQPGSVSQKMDYALANRTGVLFDSVLRVDEVGRFRIPAMIFGDTARLVFHPERERDTYIIDMVTPLDTTFTPFFSKTVFVTIKGEEALPKPDTSAYSFSFAGNYPHSITLEEIKVTGTSKIKQFEKENVSPQFRSMNARTLNGLDSDEISRFSNIWDYLRANVTGMIVSNNGFQRGAIWRGQRVAFFLDEVLVDANSLTLPPTDVAMIKVYPPPSMISAQAPGGAVAIYTKRGGGTERKSNYNYTVVGYTQGSARWDLY